MNPLNRKKISHFSEEKVYYEENRHLEIFYGKDIKELFGEDGGQATREGKFVFITKQKIYIVHIGFCLFCRIRLAY